MITTFKLLSGADLPRQENEMADIAIPAKMDNRVCFFIRFRLVGQGSGVRVAVLMISDYYP
jgi:hypothetical protein